jgi:hypothetical protein
MPGLTGLDASNPAMHNAVNSSHWFVSDMEVAMSEMADCRIEIAAAKALVSWKARFADEVVEGARRLAAQSNRPGHVTLAHYRQAAQAAARSLAAAILEGGPSRDDHQAA